MFMCCDPVHNIQCIPSPLALHHQSVCFLTSWTLEAGRPARSREWPRAPPNVPSSTESCWRCCPHSTTVWFLRPWLVPVKEEKGSRRARTNFSVHSERPCRRPVTSERQRQRGISFSSPFTCTVTPPSPLPLRPTSRCCITLESWTLLLQKRLQLCSTFRPAHWFQPCHLSHRSVKNPSLNTKVFSHFGSFCPSPC